MKSILCYGDSNTWGYNPAENGSRHKYENRWTTILQKKLGDKYHVIPEGLNGRTTVWDDPTKCNVNGRDFLLTCLESHKPLDLVIIMLGTNDLKARLNLPAVDIASGVGVLVDIVLKSSCGPDNRSPDVLVLIPPEVRKLSNFKDVFGDCVEKSRAFPKAYINMANEKGVSYIDIGKSVRFSDLDGIHYEKDELPKLAELVHKKVEELFI